MTGRPPEVEALIGQALADCADATAAFSEREGAVLPPPPATWTRRRHEAELRMPPSEAAA